MAERKRSVDRQAAAARRLFRLPEAILNLMLGGRRTTVDGVTLDRRMELFMQLSERSGKSFHPDATVADMREGYERMNRMFGFRSASASSPTVLSIPAGDALLSARLYRPAGEISSGSPLLLFYHGGGFVIGDAASYDHVARFFAARACLPVLSVDYRLAPEHAFPTAHDDAYAAYRWVVDNAAWLRVDPRRIAVGGDSAGANLAITICLRARAGALQQPNFQLLIYPPVDSTGTYRSRTMFETGVPLTPATIAWFTRHYVRQREDFAGMLLSPLNAELRGLPPAYVLAAGFDPLRDEGAAFAKALRAAGASVTYDLRPGLAHGFVALAGVVPEARRALERAADALAYSARAAHAHDESPVGAAASSGGV